MQLVKLYRYYMQESRLVRIYGLRMKWQDHNFAVSDNRWVDQELFNFWLTDHFLPNSTSQRPILLLLDGHSSHFESYSILQGNMILWFFVCLLIWHMSANPSIATSFFLSLKLYWQNSVHQFYQKNAFKKTGIYPFNRQTIRTTGELSLFTKIYFW